MTAYLNLSGQSGVREYEIVPDGIRVRFDDGSIYSYTYASAGAGNVDRMKALAQAGRGLNTFINLNVKYRYASRGR